MNTPAATAFRFKRVSPAVLAGGLFVLFAALVYTAFSLAARSAFGVALAQVPYILVCVFAVLGCGLAWRAEGRGTRTRSMWLHLTAMMALLAVGEAAFGIAQVASASAGEPLGNLALTEVLYVLAALVALSLLVLLAGGDTLRVTARVRLVADLFVYLAFLAVLGISIAAALGQGPAGDGQFALSATYFALQGVVALAIGIIVLIGSVRPGAPDWTIVLGASFVLYSLGLFMWPLWHALEYGDSFDPLQLVPELLYLVGYGMMGLAGLQSRLSDECWDVPAYHAPHEGRRAWVSVLASGVLLVTIASMVVLTILAEPGSSSQQIFLFATSIAGVAMVVRSTAVTVEQGALRSASLTDRVTRLGNLRAFHDAVDAAALDARRNAGCFSLLCIDIDDFSLVNARLGYGRGDAVLRQAAEAVCSVIPDAATAYRLSGDEFTVILPGVDAESAESWARGLVQALRAVQVEGPPLSVSVGIATFPGDAERGEQLVRSAESARDWAKSHGKDRVIAARAAVIRESGVDAAVQAERGGRLALARGLAAAVDARNVNNPYHARNVASLAVLVASRLGFDNERLDRLEIAALLHDVGTLALSDSTLTSSSRSAGMGRREHPVLGERFTESIGFADVSGWIRSHHENWDGSGFPDGLVAEDIPFEARVLALCDAYDILTGGFEQGRGISRPAALQEIDLGLGSRFDPTLAERFIRIVGGHQGLGWDDDGRAVS